MKKMVMLGVLCATTVRALADDAALAAPPPETAARPDTLQARLSPVTVGGLTSDQVAARAGETSFDAAARRQALLSAEALLDQARNAYYPKVTLTGSYTRLSDITQPPIDISAPGGMQQAPIQFVIPLNRFLFQASLSIPVSDYVLRLSQSYASASRNQRAVQLDQQAARLKASTDGKLAYY